MKAIGVAKSYANLKQTMQCPPGHPAIVVSTKQVKIKKASPDEESDKFYP